MEWINTYNEEGKLLESDDKNSLPFKFIESEMVEKNLYQLKFKRQFDPDLGKVVHEVTGNAPPSDEIFVHFL